MPGASKVWRMRRPAKVFNFFFFLILLLVSGCTRGEKDPENVLRSNLEMLYKKDIRASVNAEFEGKRINLSARISLAERSAVLFHPFTGKAYKFGGKEGEPLPSGMLPFSKILLRLLDDPFTYIKREHGKFTFFSYLYDNEERARITFYGNRLYDAAFFDGDDAYVCSITYKYGKISIIASKAFSLKILEKE